MRAEIITIGDELLAGKTRDVNSSFIAQELLKVGVQTSYFQTCEDELEIILSALKLAYDRSDIIIVTGGLGPTKDDVTKIACCQFYQTKLIRSKVAFQHLEAFFAKRERAFEGINLSQAELPEKCIYLENSHGTAPGMLFRERNKWGLFMPGVPSEMQHILLDSFMPLFLQENDSIEIEMIDIQTVGISEAKLAEIIEGLEIDFPAGVKLAYLPNLGCVTIRLYVSHGMNKVAHAIKTKIVEEVESCVFGVGDIGLEHAIINLLKQNNQTLATAESCTGGGVAKRITSVSGSSSIFEGAVVAYSNRIKNKVLNVSNLILQEKGAVSEEVVESMVKGLIELYGVDYGVAISGVAGPTGGTKEKPVGIVWLCVGDKNETMTKQLQLGGNRGQNIEVSIIAALNLLRIFILKSH